MMGMRRFPVVVALLVAGACASNPAQSSVKFPLEIPEPPPRIAMDPVPAVVAEEPVVPERPPVTPAEKTAAPKTPPAATAAAAPPAGGTDGSSDRTGAAASNSATGTTARSSGR